MAKKTFVASVKKFTLMGLNLKPPSTLHMYTRIGCMKIERLSSTIQSYRNAQACCNEYKEEKTCIQFPQTILKSETRKHENVMLLRKYLSYRYCSSKQTSNKICHSLNKRKKCNLMFGPYEFLSKHLHPHISYT